MSMLLVVAMNIFLKLLSTYDQMCNEVASPVTLLAISKRCCKGCIEGGPHCLSPDYICENKYKRYVVTLPL